MSDHTEEFWEWVDRVIGTRESSYRQIERDAGLSNGAVSKPARLRSRPTLTVIEAIAVSFGMSKIAVLQRAGVLADLDPEELSLHEIVQAAARLTPEQRMRATQYMLFLQEHDRQQQEANGLASENVPGSTAKS